MYVRVFIFALKPPYSHSGRWSSVCGLFLRFIFSASNGDSLTSICTVSSIVSYWSYHLLVGIAFFALSGCLSDLTTGVYHTLLVQ